MTEQEWLASKDPQAMFRWAKSPNVDTANKAAQCEANRRLSDRKLRLFACACFRVLHPNPMNDSEVDKDTIFAAERHADDPRFPLPWLGYWVVSPDVREAAHDAATCTPGPARVAALIRDIAGNPWRPVTLNPAWLTPTVVSLAQAAYDERVAPCGRCGGSGTLLDIEDFDTDARTEESCGRCHGTGIIDDGTLDPVRLAILADALEEAGCPAEEDRTEPVKVYVQNHGQGWYVMHGIPSGARIMHKVGSRREAVRYAEEVYRVKKWTTKSDASTKLAPSERPCWGDGLVNVPGGPHPLLAHLRESGAIHVRGCWAVDLILGKS